MSIIENNILQISELCKTYKVSKLYAFGSVLTPAFTSNSDIDLLVAFNKNEINDPFENFFDFIYSLQNLLGRKIDLIEESAISNQTFKENVLKSRKLIYGEN